MTGNGIEAFPTWLPFVILPYLFIGFIVCVCLAGDARTRKGGSGSGDLVSLVFGDPIGWIVLPFLVFLWPVLLIWSRAEMQMDRQAEERMSGLQKQRDFERTVRTEEERSLVGTTARTMGDLRPYGRILAGDRVIEARVERGFIATGTPVRIESFKNGIAVVSSVN